MSLCSLAALIAVAGCVGTIEGLPAGPGEQRSRACETPAVGTHPLRRLSHAEYDQTLRDLFDLSADAHPSANLPSDAQHGYFDTEASMQTVPESLAAGYADTAVAVAEDIDDVAHFAGCTTIDAACAQSFAERFGRRAYRRPLTAEEVASLVQIFTETAAASDPETGVRGMIVAALVSPNFIFRPEVGEEGTMLAGARQATQYELAARLASLIWASTPDDALLDAAENGELETREAVAERARRMLEDPRARTALRHFYEQWIGLPLVERASKSPDAYPEFNETLRTSMIEETRRFIDHVLWEDDGRLATLLTAPYSFVNEPLARLYDVAGTADEKTFQRVELDRSERSGILTHASVLAALAAPDASSPIKRGQWLRVNVLCQPLPPPPNNVPMLPQLEEGISNRERFAMHTSDPACSSCHRLIDGLGFGLEEYDGIGRHRTVDRGIPIDTNGEVLFTEDADGPFQGGVQLGRMLSSSTQVRDCAATHWLRYTLGRMEMPADACSRATLLNAFATSDGNLLELIVALTQTDAFWTVQVEG